MADGMGSQARGPGAPGLGRETASLAREKAGAPWADAKETARAKLDERKDEAATGLDEVAQALHDAARRQHEHGDGLARLTGSAADSLERFSGALRSKDVTAMLGDIESFARRQPVAFFGMALAAGFLAARAMKVERSTREMT
jgi:hypothetical protein